MASLTATPIEAPLKASRHPDLERFRDALGAGRPREHAYSLLFGLRLLDARGVVKLVEAGLPYQALERFQQNADLPLRELAEAISVPLRTLDRRRSAGRLEPDESDRAVRLSRIFAAALGLFEGDDDAARAWLKKRQPMLGNERPIDLVKTEVGAREVERLVGRLEHGVFS